jgi:uncharacterized linocin/CFP29 family protein
MKKAEVIKAVKSNISSIYTKDDVLALINSLEDSSPYVSQEKLNECIRKSIENTLGNMSCSDVVDCSTAEFDIQNGNEINLTHVDFDENNILNDIMNDLESEIDEFFSDDDDDDDDDDDAE